MKRLFCALAALALLISAACLAEIPEPTEDFWVLDQAGVLSDATEGEIFFANQRLFDACGAEIVVVAVDTAGEMRLEDYCYALYNDWGISERGLLLVMAVDDEACYAMAGVAFDSVFSSGAIDQLFREALAADFNAGDYDAAARSFFEAAFARAADAMNVDVSAADGVADYNDFLKQNSNGAPASERGETAMRSPEPRSNGGNAMPVLIVVALILLCVLLGSMGWRRHYRGTFSAPPPRFGGFIFRPRRSPRASAAAPSSASSAASARASSASRRILRRAPPERRTSGRIRRVWRRVPSRRVRRRAPLLRRRADDARRRRGLRRPPVSTVSGRRRVWIGNERRARKERSLFPRIFFVQIPKKRCSGARVVL